MQKKKGISLIVLVITVIVMVILAGAIVLTLNNSGIISKATDAVNKTNEATIKEVAQLGWAEAYAEYGADLEKLEEGVKNALEKNNINTDEYEIIVTTSGVTINRVTISETEPTKNVWIKEGFTVVKGDIVLEIGDTINYTATGTTYNGGWKVLGADEAGNLLIMSADNVKSSHALGSEQSDWLNAPAELDSICEAYGNGEGVVGKARSITVEDVNSVTGYDPNTYGVGTVEQYGNKVTYKYNGSIMPAYESAVANGTTVDGEHYNGFFYYDEKTGTMEHITDLTTGKNGDPFAEITTTYYEYDLSGIKTKDNEKAVGMLFGDDGMASYWLASNYVHTEPWDCVAYGLFLLEYGNVYGYAFWYSAENEGDSEEGAVRAVVTLSSDIQITEKTAQGWNYTIN